MAKTSTSRQEMPDPLAEVPRANLTGLADRFGSDWGWDYGWAQHRDTELYHMLFHPWRDQPITLLKMALFRAFRKTRSFRHDDVTAADAFNALAPQISGCFLFQVGHEQTRRDQVAVVHKR